MVGTSPGRYSGSDNGWSMGYATSIVNNFTDTMRKYPNIPTVPASAAIGSDLPEFVVPNLVAPPEPTSAGGATASHVRQ
jgi:hypothetical protein